MILLFAPLSLIYDYLQELNSFVAERSYRHLKKMQQISETEFIEIGNYYDSIWLEKITREE